MRIWPFIPRKPVVVFGGQRLKIEPLSLENLLEVILLLAPYFSLVEENWTELSQAAANRHKHPQFLSRLLFVLREAMQETPGDLVKTVALLSSADPVWLAERATAEELIAALPTLDKAHNLSTLWAVVRQGTLFVTGDEM